MLLTLIPDLVVWHQHVLDPHLRSKQASIGSRPSAVWRTEVAGTTPQNWDAVRDDSVAFVSMQPDLCEHATLTYTHTLHPQSTLMHDQKTE